MQHAMQEEIKTQDTIRWWTFRFLCAKMIFASKYQTILFAIVLGYATSFQTSGSFRKPATSLNLSHEDHSGESMEERRHFMKKIVSGLGIASLISSSTFGSPSIAFAEDESLVDVYYGVGEYAASICDQFMSLDFHPTFWFVKPNYL